jgi:hypothetical protein
MALSDLTSPTAVRRAIEQCNHLGRDHFLKLFGFGEAREYLLGYQDTTYDSKAIAGVAHGIQYPSLGALKSTEFSGGISNGAAATRLFELGFNIQGLKRRETDWSLSECQVAVQAYFDCLNRKLCSQKFNREAACRDVAVAIGRTRGAVDYKFQNIDAILLENELPRLDNAVARNVQRLLRYVVLDPLASHTQVFAQSSAMPQAPLQLSDLFVSIPRTTRDQEKERTAQNHIIKTDFALIDARNRLLGTRGEEWVLSVERQRLQVAGRKDLADRIRWTSQLCGDGMGYDIDSFDEAGNSLFIEVKTTNGGSSIPFFISPNELAVSERQRRAFRLYRVFNFSQRPQIFVIEGPLANKLRLEPRSYCATPVCASAANAE